MVLSAHDSLVDCQPVLCHIRKLTMSAAATRQKAKDGGKVVSDQWVDPFVIVDKDDKPVGPVEDGDAVVVFNFRADRVVEISKALEYPDFKGFDRKRFPKVRELAFVHVHAVAQAAV